MGLDFSQHLCCRPALLRRQLKPVTANLISFRSDERHFSLSSQFVGEEQAPALAIDNARIQEPTLAAMFDGLAEFHTDRAAAQTRPAASND